MARTNILANKPALRRNHAVIAMDEDWRLSPAYDLVLAMPIGPERREGVSGKDCETIKTAFAYEGFRL